MEVIDFPPVAIVGHSLRRSRPGRKSYAFNLQPRYSQSHPSRQMYDIEVSDIGKSRGDAGYLYMLGEMLDGKLPLVRIEPKPPLWHGATRGLHHLRGEHTMSWEEYGRYVDWGVTWTVGTAIDAVAEDDEGFDAIRCTALPASRYVAFAGELVTAETGETARVLKHERSDETGTALIRLAGPLPTGQVTIGTREQLVMEITQWGMPGFGQAPGSTALSLRQVFQSEFETDFTYIEPFT